MMYDVDFLQPINLVEKRTAKKSLKKTGRIILKKKNSPKFSVSSVRALFFRAAERAQTFSLISPDLSRKSLQS